MTAMKRILTLSLSVLFVVAGCRPAYQNTKLSFEERADDLLQRMTLEEKASFLKFDSPAIERLGIPAYNHWSECLHGVARAGEATVFPMPIGLAATDDSLLMYRIGTAVSDEARAKYHDFVSRGKRGIYRGLTYFTPNINIFRDPRWGRGMETYGESPALTARMAVPFIRGLQGDDPKYLKLIATAKHFAVHSGPEGIRHSFDVSVSPKDFAETYTPQFKAAVQEAGVYSVMCAYQRIDGVPCCGNRMLSDLLRNDWGFEGYIVTDCGAITDFYSEGGHNMGISPVEAGAMAIKAGTDLNCGSVFGRYLVQAVEEGYLTEEDLDKAVRRIIIARMKLGLFDPDSSVPYSKIPYSTVCSEEHSALALEAARKSMVLLRNENGLLPLDKDLKKVAVIGPNADNMDVLMGNYNGFPRDYVTPLQGIRAKLPDAEVTYAQGCRLAAELPQLTPIPSEYLYTDNNLTDNGVRASYYKPAGKAGTKGGLYGVDSGQKSESGDYSGEQSLFDCTYPAIDLRWRDPHFDDIAAGGNNSINLPRILPPEGVPFDKFVTVLDCVLVPPITGEYALGCEGYSGFSMTIDGEEFMSGGNEHEPTRRYESVYLNEGQSYHITVTYRQEDSEYPMVRLLWDMPGRDLEKEALEAAKASDVVIFCMGISPQLEGEELPVRVPGFERGDRVEIGLPACQTELMKKVAKLKKPMVLVLMNGSALAVNWENENIPAIVEAWYPGQEGGTAVADVLFGDFAPVGKLPVTFYRSAADLPAFTDYRMDDRGAAFTGPVLYPFGYGLTY